MTTNDPDYALSQQIKAEARSLPDFIEWAVAVLIAEGGETIWWCEEHRNMGTDNRCWRSLAMAFQVQYANVANGLELESPNFPDCHMVERLVFGPIPAEKETTT